MTAKDWIVRAILGLLAAAGLTFAYMTSVPDSALWTEAEALPAPWGERFAGWHRSFAPAKRVEPRRVDEYGFPVPDPPPPPPPGAPRPTRAAPLPPLPPELLPPSTGRPVEGPAPPAVKPEFVFALPGVVVRQAPAENARALATVTRLGRLPRLERRDDWFRVWHEGREGWILLPGYDESGQGPPLGDAPAPVGPLPARLPTSEQVSAARALFGGEQRGLRWGGFEVYTDLANDAQLARLGDLAAGLERVYRQRHQRTPVGEARGVILLFAAEADYRRLQDQSREILGLPAAGHNDRGLVALFVAERPEFDVAATLVHELVHLTNRRAIGPQLPPWLDEGLAEDLAMSDLSGGQIAPTLFGGEIRVEAVEGGQRRIFQGAPSSLFHVRAALLDKRLPTFAELSALDWTGFVRSADRRLHYDLAGLWVRFLHDAEGGRHRAGWQKFLAGVAGGGQPRPAALLEALAVDADLLEANFRAWLLDAANRQLGPA